MEREHCWQTENAQVWFESPIDASVLTGWSFGRCVFFLPEIHFRFSMEFFPVHED